MILGQGQRGGRNQGGLDRALLEAVRAPLASVEQIVHVPVADERREDQHMQERGLGKGRAYAIRLVK